MLREFNVIDIHANLPEKKIILNFSLDVDENTVANDSIVLIERKTGRIASAVAEVNRNIVELTLLDWPTPNSEYLLQVQKGVRSIVEDELPESLQRAIIFKSEITSTIDVLSPAEYEEVSELKIAWQESVPDESMELVNSYYIEIAKENAFYNIVKKTEVTGKQEINLANDLPNGQYYLRIRAQKGNQYGRWSEIITFIVEDENKKPGSIYGDDDEIIFEDELRLVALPENGERLESFLFEFDEEIDPDSIEEIIVIRRRI